MAPMKNFMSVIEKAAIKLCHQKFVFSIQESLLFLFPVLHSDNLHNFFYGHR